MNSNAFDLWCCRQLHELMIVLSEQPEAVASPATASTTTTLLCI